MREHCSTTNYSPYIQLALISPESQLSYHENGTPPDRIHAHLDLQSLVRPACNVDIRQDQRYLAEKDLFPCGDRDESRFSPDFQVPLSVLGMEVAGDPNFPRVISCVQVLNERKQRFEGPEKVVLADLLEFIKVHDPDVILFPYADTWVPLIVKKARRLGLEPTFTGVDGSSP